MDVLHVIVSAIGGAGGVAVIGDRAMRWLEKREETNKAKAQGDARLAVERTKASRERQRADDDSRRIELQAKTAQADAHGECLELAREQGRTIKDQGREIGIVKDAMAGMARDLGVVVTKLEHCEGQHTESIRRHDEKDGLIVRLKSRIEVLERRSNPSPAE